MLGGGGFGGKTNYVKNVLAEGEVLLLGKEGQFVNGSDTFENVSDRHKTARVQNNLKYPQTLF